MLLLLLLLRLRISSRCCRHGEMIDGADAETTSDCDAHRARRDHFRWAVGERACVTRRAPAGQPADRPGRCAEPPGAEHRRATASTAL